MIGRGHVLQAVLFLSCGFVLAGCSFPSASPGRLASATVNLEGTASGTVVGYEDGHAFILTAEHVVRGRNEMSVAFCRYGRYGFLTASKIVSAKVVRRDEAIDLVGMVCRIEPEWASPATVTDREWPSVGEVLWTCGCPGGGPFLSIRRGLMGGWKYAIGRRQRGVFTGGVVEGCSGSGVFDSQGNLVGVVSQMGIYKMRGRDGKAVLIRDPHCGIFVPVNRELVRKFARIGDER